MNRKIIYLCLSAAALLMPCAAAAQQTDFAAWMQASEEAPYGVTQLMHNPTGTEGYGWNRHSSDAAAGYNKHNTEFASAVYDGTGIESWYWKPVPQAELIWQDVSGLLPGTYRITAYAVAQIYNDGARKGQCGTGAWLFAGQSRKPITSNKWQELSLTVTLQAGETLRVGICGDDTNENDWVSIAGVRMACTGVDTSVALPISLDENFDVSVARQLELADVHLFRTLSTLDYTPLCLPFAMDEEQCASCFADIQQVVGIDHVEEGTVYLATTPAVSIQAGQPFLVRGRANGRTMIAVPSVLVSQPAPASLSCNGGYHIVCTYRSQEGLGQILCSTGGTYAQPQDDGRVRGYSFYLTH